MLFGRKRFHRQRTGPVTRQRGGLRAAARVPTRTAHAVDRAENGTGAQGVAEVDLPGQGLLSRQGATGVADERSTEILGTVAQCRTCVEIVRALEDRAHHRPGDRAGFHVVPERAGIELVPVALQRLLALDAGVECSGHERVRGRALERAQRNLGDHPCHGFGSHFRDGGANDLRYRSFGQCHRPGDLCRRRPVDPRGRDQRRDCGCQCHEVRDEHFLRELDLGRHAVDRIRQLAQLPGDLVD